MKKALAVKDKQIEPKFNLKNVNKSYLIPKEEIYFKAPPHTNCIAPNPDDQSNQTAFPTEGFPYHVTSLHTSMQLERAETSRKETRAHPAFHPSLPSHGQRMSTPSHPMHPGRCVPTSPFSVSQKCG